MLPSLFGAGALSTVAEGDGAGAGVAAAAGFAGLFPDVAAGVLLCPGIGFGEAGLSVSSFLPGAGAGSGAGAVGGVSCGSVRGAASCVGAGTAGEGAGMFIASGERRSCCHWGGRSRRG